MFKIANFYEQMVDNSSFSLLHLECYEHCMKMKIVAFDFIDVFSRTLKCRQLHCNNGIIKSKNDMINSMACIDVAKYILLNGKNISKTYSQLVKLTHV